MTSLASESDDSDGDDHEPDEGYLPLQLLRPQAEAGSASSAEFGRAVLLGRHAVDAWTTHVALVKAGERDPLEPPAASTLASAAAFPSSFANAAGTASAAQASQAQPEGVLAQHLRTLLSHAFTDGFSTPVPEGAADLVHYPHLGLLQYTAAAQLSGLEAELAAAFAAEVALVDADTALGTWRLHLREAAAQLRSALDA